MEQEQEIKMWNKTLLNFGIEETECNYDRGAKTSKVVGFLTMEEVIKMIGNSASNELVIK